MKTLLLLAVGLLGAQTTNPPLKTFTVTSTTLIELGSGLVYVFDAAKNKYTLQVDNAYTMVRVAPPTSWPPPTAWCFASAQRAEDGLFEYACHTNSDGTLKPYRIMLQMAP